VQAIQRPSFHPAPSGEIRAVFLVGGGGDAFEIGRQRIVADEPGAMLCTSGSHRHGFDLSLGNQLIELAPAYTEVMRNLLWPEPLGAVRLRDLGVGGVSHRKNEY
jgi:hypothetical protein